MFKHAAILCLSICASGAVALAQAPETSSGWNLFRYTMTYSGFAVKKDIVGKPLPGETIFTNSDAAGDVALTCLLDKLSSTIEVKPTDFATFVTTSPNTQRARYRNVRLRINGEKVSNNKWTYVPKHKVILARSQSDTNKIYNAGVNGNKVSVQVGNGKIIELNIPEMDDAFAEFGGACNLGRNK